LGVLAVPLWVGVWLHEFEWATYVSAAGLDQELFYSDQTPGALTNRQILWTAVATLAAAVGVAWRTRTTAHSAQAAGAMVLGYTALLLFYDLKPHVNDQRWALLAVQYLPLAGILAGLACWILRRPERSYQASPWIHVAAALTILVLYGIALNGLQEWTGLDSSLREPASFLLLSLLGAGQTVLGLAARHGLRHRGRLAVLGLIWFGLVNVLAGLALAGQPDLWPPNWWSPLVLGQQVAVPHLVMPLVAVGIALLACRVQMFTFLGLGLAGLAVSIHMLGEFYFHAIAGWPKWIMAVGAACLVLALFKELRRTRGRAVDDEVSQNRL
jgi:hypothetical protein